MPAAARKRTIVGRPMTPELMVRTGGLKTFPETPADFDPRGAWVNKYRIHTCHGYFESSNEEVGVLRVERSQPDTGKGFVLKVRRRIVSSEGDTSVSNAWIRAAADPLASLLEWRVENRHENIDGVAIPDLQTEESGRLEAGQVLLRNGRAKRSRPQPQPLTSDWSLFAAVQTLGDGAAPDAEFDILGGLRVFRRRQRLVRRAPYRLEPFPPMRWLAQTGSGLLPYEYWLDEKGRLLAAATGPRGYVLDDAAEERVDARLAAIRARRERRRHG